VIAMAILIIQFPIQLLAGSDGANDVADDRDFVEIAAIALRTSKAW
jgi:hypothetical protein